MGQVKRIVSATLRTTENPPQKELETEGLISFVVFHCNSKRQETFKIACLFKVVDKMSVTWLCRNERQ